MVNGDRPAGAGRPERPIWRRDFPYSAGGEDDVTRREFVRYLVLGSGAFAVGTVGVAGLTTLREPDRGEPRPIIERDRLRPNEAYLFRYPSDDDPAILVLHEDGDLRAFSQKCTHLGCVVYFDAEDDLLVCPCHEGGFSAVTGDVAYGPPERPLPEIEVEERDGMIWALGVEHG